MIAGGYTPGGGAKWDSKRVSDKPFRRPVGRTYNERVARMMEKAIAIQLEQGKRVGLGKLRSML